MCACAHLCVHACVCTSVCARLRHLRLPRTLDPADRRCPHQARRALTWDGQVVEGHVPEPRAQRRHPVRVHIPGAGPTREAARCARLSAHQRQLWVTWEETRSCPRKRKQQSSLPTGGRERVGTRVQKTSGERQTEMERETDRHTDPEGGGGEERLEADTENALF